MLNQEEKILFNIQNTSSPFSGILPFYEPLYQIDLNTRTIEKPDTVVVKKDHYSTVYHFSVDRYFDYMDLSTTSCIIIYNIDGQNYVYPVPFYDTATFNSYNKMIIPWQIDRGVTAKEGNITFSFRFFKVTGDTENNAEIAYSLNTQPQILTISKGLDAPDLHVGDLDQEQNEKLSFLYTLIDTVKKAKDD